jgi:tetratricopeptide (TPR) repeat protein
VGHLIVAVIFMSFPQSLGFATDTPAQDRLRQATQLISEEKFEAARQILEAMLAASEHPPPETYYQLTLCYLKQTEWKKAEETLQTFLRLSPENFLALYLKGYLLFSTQRYEESLRVLEPLIERQPGNAASHKVIGLDHFMLGRIEQAEAEMKRATELAPKDAEALYYLGRIYFTRNNLPASLATFQRTAELDPSSVKTFNHLGQTYEALVQYSAARSAYLRAIELEKHQPTRSEWPYFNLGALYLKEGRAAEAVDYLQEALSRHPAWSEGKAKLAMALVSLGKHDEALSLLEDAVRLDRRNADARYQYARLLAKMGKEDEAERQLQLFQELKEP